MSFLIPEDLHPSLVPLAWLIGDWEGEGTVGLPGDAGQAFRQRVEFSHDGRDFLAYRSTTELLDADGAPVGAGDAETGYWRAVVPQGDAEGVGLEVQLLHPTGLSETLVGHVGSAQIDLVTAGVVRTEQSTSAYAAGQRLYGYVKGRLMWVLTATFEGREKLQPYCSAILTRPGATGLEPLPDTLPFGEAGTSGEADGPSAP